MQSEITICDFDSWSETLDRKNVNKGQKKKRKRKKVPTQRSKTENTISNAHIRRIISYCCYLFSRVFCSINCRTIKTNTQL